MFVNYLSTIPVVKGITLSYVVCANEDPDHETDFEGDIVARSIACAPLNNATFCVDARKVHQLLMNFLVAESAEQWIKNLAPRVNGRLDMEALRNHYGGEGNASRRIATAEKLRETLHYKSERSMPFSTFLDRMHKMFNIFQGEGKEFTENAKVRELLKHVQNNQLQDTVKALRVQFHIDGISYTEAANHLTSTVSELPKYLLARRVSSLKRIRGGRSERVRTSSSRTVSMQMTEPYSQDTIAIGNPFQRTIMTKSLQNGKRRTQMEGSRTTTSANWLKYKPSPMILP